MRLRWSLARVLYVSGDNAVRGLLSWDVHERSEAELDKRLFPHAFIFTLTTLTPVYKGRVIQQPGLNPSSHVSPSSSSKPFSRNGAWSHFKGRVPSMG